MATSFRVQIRCRPESLREVRDAVDTLDIDKRIFEAVKLVTHELVSNSISHSGLGEDDCIEVTVARQRYLVRIDVYDAGGGFTLPPDDQPQRFGGRGLAMAQALSTLVGISHSGETHAWAELELPQPGPI